MASRPHIKGTVSAVRTAITDDGEDGYEVVVKPDDLFEAKCDGCGGDLHEITLPFSADQTAARRYRVGDEIEVVAFKRSARTEPKS